MAPARFLPFALFVLVAIVCGIIAESTPLPATQRIIHTRFVRRNFQQPPDDDKQTPGAVSIRHEAPPPSFMNDEDLVRFVQCTYDPSITGCNRSEENEEYATVDTPGENVSQEESPREPIVEEVDEDDDDYSFQIDDSVLEYINRHLEPIID